MNDAQGVKFGLELIDRLGFNTNEMGYAKTAKGVFAPLQVAQIVQECVAEVVDEQENDQDQLLLWDCRSSARRIVGSSRLAPRYCRLSRPADVNAGVVPEFSRFS